MELKTTSIGHLCSLLTRGPNPIFLLGAGASVTSGIPLADEIVEKIVKWGYRIAKWGPGIGDASFVDGPYIPPSDWLRWLQNQPWYREDLSMADHYPRVVDNILRPRQTRKDFFQELINPQVPPSSGYKQMAELMARERVRTILTTNFDKVLPNFWSGHRRPYQVEVIQTPSDFMTITTTPRYPQIIYLHGSIPHYTDRNSLAEIEKPLDTRLVSMLLPLLRDHPLIVMGYRGAEPSVMQHFLINCAEDVGKYRHGIYWCARNYDEEGPKSLNPSVHELAHKTEENFQIVSIDGFDEVMAQLWKHVCQLPEVHLTRTADYTDLDALPYDLQPLNALSLEDFEWATLRTRLEQYCERLDIPVPRSVDDDWIFQCMFRQHLASRTEDEKIHPTVGGYLLFATMPQRYIQSAQVRVHLKGSAEWLASVLDDTGDEGEIVEDRIELIIEGNLWSQLDAIYDILTLVNQSFLLKDEVSKTVYPYPSIALREMVVNALVHRDYTEPEPIVIKIEQTRISVRNPGGLVEEVLEKIKNPSGNIKAAFENKIKGGAGEITGYRNRVVADLFYGAGTMEKEGSGLAEIYRSGKENNNEVNFGPVDDNTAFEITLHRRPEVVDEVTRTAAHSNFTRHASNLLEVVAMPEVVWHAGTSARKAKDVWKHTEAAWLPPFLPYAKRLFTFHNLLDTTNPFRSQIDVNDIQKATVEEFIAEYGERCFVWLLNECLYRHFKAQNLFIDKDRMRAYFPRSDEGPRAIRYQARIRQATRTVVKRKSGHWEHKSFRFGFERFGETWTLVLLPGYVFTTDGKSDLLEGKLVNRLSTKREGRDYNNIVHNDLVFWAWVLSGGQHSTFALNMGPGDVQDSLVSLKETHDGSNEPQIQIKANLSTTVVHNVEAEDALHYKHIEELERNRLARLESEFAGEISQLPEVKDANSN